MRGFGVLLCALLFAQVVFGSLIDEIVNVLSNPCLSSVTDPNCGGNLAAVYRYGDVTNCSLIHINFQNGYVFNVSTLNVCKDRSTSGTGIARSALDLPTHTLFFTTGTGKFIHAIDNFAGTSFAFAYLPSSYSDILGIYTWNSNVYMCTTDTIYVAQIDGSKKTRELEILTKFTQVVSEDTIVAAGNGTLYLLDGPIFYSFRLQDGKQTSQPTTIQGLTRPMDIQWRHTSALIVLDSYQLFSVPLSGSQLAESEAANFLVNIPDGPGFPVVNDLFFDSFFFSDFSNLYLIDLSANNTVHKPVPFDGYFCQGLFHMFF